VAGDDARLGHHIGTRRLCTIARGWKLNCVSVFVLPIIPYVIMFRVRVVIFCHRFYCKINVNTKVTVNTCRRATQKMPIIIEMMHGIVLSANNDHDMFFKALRKTLVSIRIDWVHVYKKEPFPMSGQK